MLMSRAPAPQLTPFSLDNYDRLSVFSNPKSKRAQAGTIEPVINRLIKVGLQAGLEVGDQPTRSSSEAMMGALEKTQPHDLLAVVSGDGGTSHFLRAVLALRLDNPVVLIGGGDANDQARNLHTKKNVRKPFKILNDPGAKIGQLHPLAVRIHEPQTEAAHQTTAFGYVGIGLTALVGDEFNQPAFRAEVKGLSEWQRLLKEWAIVREKINEASVLSVANAAAHIPLRTLEYNIINGRNEAKFFKFPGMSALERDAGSFGMPIYNSGESTKLERYYATFIRGIVGATIHGDIKHFGEGEERQFTVVSGTGEVPVQIDGEAQPYPSGTAFNVGISEQFVNVVTTRKHAA